MTTVTVEWSMLIYLIRKRLDPLVLRQRIRKLDDTTVHTYPNSRL